MRQIKTSLPVLLGLMLFPIFCTKAEACSCAPKGTPCEVYGAATAVFIGSVMSQEGNRHDRVYTIKVGEVFLGSLAPILKAYSSDMTCGYEFQADKRYLIYVYDRLRPGEDTIKEFLATYCGRTAPVEKAEEDLRFLRTERQQMRGSRIYGETVRDYRYDLSLPEGKRYRPVPGIRIKVEGQGKTYELVTNENGMFELDGLPAGEYHINLLLPDNLQTYGSSSRRIYINEHGCSSLWFWIQNK